MEASVVGTSVAAGSMVVTAARAVPATVGADSPLSPPQATSSTAPTISPHPNTIFCLRM